MEASPQSCLLIDARKSRLELETSKRGCDRRSRTTQSAARQRVNRRRGTPPRLSLGIRRPDRRIPPLLCPDLPGFRQGSVLADSEQHQTQAGRDPHILFRDGTPEMRSRHSVVCIYRLPNNSFEPTWPARHRPWRSSVASHGALTMR